MGRINKNSVAIAIITSKITKAVSDEDFAAIRKDYTKAMEYKYYKEGLEEALEIFKGALFEKTSE